MQCSACQEEFTEVCSEPAKLCQNCDRYNIFRYPWRTITEFLEFLNGKKFVYTHDTVYYFNAEEPSSLKLFTDAIISSPRVFTIHMNELTEPGLIWVLDLMEKLPKCTDIRLEETSITEHNAPYLAKLISIPSIKHVYLTEVLVSAEAVQILAEKMDPACFDKLQFQKCVIPSMAPVIYRLVDSKLNSISNYLGRNWNDDECTALAHVFRHNKHVKIFYMLQLSSNGSRVTAESLIDSESIEQFIFTDCDLQTAIPAIAKALQFSETIKLCKILRCDVTLAQLTEVCNGIQKRKTDLQLFFNATNHYDTLDPIRELLENNAMISKLVLILSLSPEAWISVIGALKKNSILKQLEIYPKLNSKVSPYTMEELAKVLEVNTALRSLSVNTPQSTLGLDQLITVICSQNKLEYLLIHDGIFERLNFANICELLKRNRKLKKIILLKIQLNNNDEEEHNRLFAEVLEENGFLEHCLINCNHEHTHSLPDSYKERNQKYKLEWAELKQNIIVLIHNMARNSNLVTSLLPTEVWFEIFKRIRHPVSPINGLEDVAKRIFKYYKIH